ncbi:MAG TPA: aspartate-semialdehyde dehydrogenase [Gemmatimonadaceae bacterium]|nr:aspartate-semialdehyde dehydrogenase [Gemmatimonadaceae bacterium]
MTRESPFGHKRVPVAVLGATGAVGQAFVRLLANHPWFELIEVAASERSAGRAYAEATRWIGDDAIPSHIAKLTVLACDPGVVTAPVVFSALDSSVAGDAEQAFARAARVVLSNAKNHRMDVDVPLVIAEVNPGHLAVLDQQRRNRKWSGAIVTNGNCAAIAAVLPLAPLHESFGVTRVFIATMQAVSGAGYPGVASLDILGNVIPYIKDEEPKLEAEVRKFLGTQGPTGLEDASIGVSSHTNRVPVEHGHTVVMSVELKRKAGIDDIQSVMREWRGASEAQGLPSSPERALVVAEQPDRPQPRRDLDAGHGMTVTVGRVRPDPMFDVRLAALGHNIVRGAAGASVLNAELMAATGRLGVS